MNTNNKNYFQPGFKQIYSTHNYNPDDIIRQVYVIEDRISRGLLHEAQTQFRYVFDLVWGSYASGMIYDQVGVDQYKIALYKILVLIPSFLSLTYGQRIRLCVLKTLLYRRISSWVANRHLDNLEIVCTFSVKKCQQELRDNEYLWTSNTGRQNMKHSPHQKTNVIELLSRNRPWASSFFVSNRVRYAQPHPGLVDLFPQTFSLLRKIEHTLNGELARVALVRLKPYALVYGHCDCDHRLRGFDRYHLVLTSPQGSYMHVGNDQVIFKEGDLFFFENKVWHTAYNHSSEWRVHLIIDIRRSKSETRSLAIHAYQDWCTWKHVSAFDQL